MNFQNIERPEREMPELHRVLTDDDVEAMRKRVQQRRMIVTTLLGDKHVCAKPVARIDLEKP